MKNVLLSFILLLFVLLMQAQNNVGIGVASPDPSSLLELNATDKGLLIPRLTTAQRTAIANPAEALLVYDTDFKCFYYYSSGTWISLCSLSGVTGATGQQGLAGATGPIGAVGPTGVAGATGPQGVTGIGVTGATGLQGITGPTGLAGICIGATTDFVSKFTSPTTICNSIIYDNGTQVGISTTTPAEVLTVNGNIEIDGALKGSVRYYVSSNTASGNHNSDYYYLTLSGVTPGTSGPADYIITYSWCGTDHVTSGTDVMSVDYTGDAGAGNTYITSQAYTKDYLTNNNMVCETYTTIATIAAGQTWTFKIVLRGSVYPGEIFNGTITALRVN